MKNTAVIFFLLFCQNIFFAQQPFAQSASDSFSVEYLGKHAHSFFIKNGILMGAGSDLMKKAIAESQFVVLGEYHGSSSIAKFTEAVLPELNKNGFKNFAIEVGPYSANILEELSTPYPHASDNLFELNTKYYVAAMEDTPIPFFHGKEDVAFLQKASELGFDLWGLDQEYYYSVAMLGDVLLEREIGNKNYEEIAQVKKQLDSLYLAEDKISEEKPRGYRMFKNVLESPITNRFFNYFSGDEETEKMIAALKKSWDIYDRTDYRGGYSHGTRVSYIRNNFIKNYEASEEGLPKVLVKVGGFHAGKSYAGSVYDVGNLADELAKRNGTGCTNIIFNYRYWEEDGKVVDESGNEKNAAKKAFMQLGEKDRYVVVDLRPIAEQMRNFSLKVPNDVTYHYLKYTVENFDLMIINPLDREVFPNFEAKK